MSLAVAGCTPTAANDGNGDMVLTQRLYPAPVGHPITNIDRTFDSSIDDADGRAFVDPKNFDDKYLSKSYDYASWLFAQKRRPAHAVMISMSGGGTRAATLAKSVLDQLALYSYADPTVHGGRRTLADSVIAISATSGGAMTAAAYGLARASCDPAQTADTAACVEQWLKDRDFEGKILKAHLLNHFLLHSVARPTAWHDRAKPFEDLFDDAFPRYAPSDKASPGPRLTFRDLAKPYSPFLFFESTDIDGGRAFSFVQESFSDLCSNLMLLPVSVATAAAGNFPFLSTDIELRNYRADPRCWANAAPNNASQDQKAEEDEDIHLRQQMNHPYSDNPDATAANCGPDGADADAKQLSCTVRARYRMAMRAVGPGGAVSPTKFNPSTGEPSRTIDWVHLYDGGLADNLALWPLIHVLETQMYMRRMASLGVKDVTLVVVNARSDQDQPNDEAAGSPDFLDLFVGVSYDPIDRATALTETFALSDLEIKAFHLCHRAGAADRALENQICVRPECRTFAQEHMGRIVPGVGDYVCRGEAAAPVDKDASKDDVAKDESWRLGTIRQVMYPTKIYPVIVDFDALAGSPNIVKLRETVKNIETQDPLDVPPKYTNRPDFQCNELLCDQDKAKPGQDKKKPGLDVVKIAGGVLVLQDPCIKFLTQAEVEPKVAKTTAAQPASVVSPQPEQISDVNSDACQAAETINLPGARVDELNANERFLRQLDAK